MTEESKRLALMARLAHLRNAMQEAMSQGGTHKIFVDPVNVDDITAAIGFVALASKVPNGHRGGET